MASVTRRHLLTGVASAIALAPFVSHASARDSVDFTSDPFTLGVASGDPDATSVVLWTRLAPVPLQPDSGMPPVSVPVDWEVAADDKMQKIVRRGTVDARPEDGHSLHAVAKGLEPARTYWYRFTTRNAQSPIGRTRTLPAPGTLPLHFRMAVAGCQRIEQGYFAAWDDIAKSDLDLVFHYGDYIYEYDLNRDVISARMGHAVPDEALPRMTTLAQYRMRYALYKLDPDLAGAHAAHPFAQSFDDHEVSNDWGGLSSGSFAMSEAEFLQMRAAALQAYYENAPVRPALRPQGAVIKAYRSLDVGGLIRLAVLDTRQYRSMPACGKAGLQQCAERLQAGRSMIGDDQERWLIDLFGRKDTAWTVLGNQVMMMQERYKDPGVDIVDTDKWDGNAAARQRLLQAAADRKVSGLVVTTGDIHKSFAGNLKTDFNDTTALPVGVEFVASSISSGGDGAPEKEIGEKLRAANPHMRFYDGRRGYVICSFDKSHCQATFRALDTVSKRGASVSTIATYEVDAQNQGISG